MTSSTTVTTLASEAQLTSYPCLPFDLQTNGQLPTPRLTVSVHNSPFPNNRSALTAVLHSKHDNFDPTRGTTRAMTLNQRETGTSHHWK